MKSILLTLVLVLLFGFVSESKAQSIVTGDLRVNSSTPGYTLHKNKGDRVFTKYIQFEKGYEKPPKVIFFVNQLESKKERNVRYDVSADVVTRDGFNMRIKTWGDSELLSIGVTWMVISEE